MGITGAPPLDEVLATLFAKILDCNQEVKDMVQGKLLRLVQHLTCVQC